MTAFPNAHQPDPNSTPVDGSMLAGMTGRTTNISVPPQPQGAYAIPGSPAPVPPGGQPATIIPETTQGTAIPAPPKTRSMMHWPSFVKRVCRTTCSAGSIRARW